MRRISAIRYLLPVLAVVVLAAVPARAGEDAVLTWADIEKAIDRHPAMGLAQSTVEAAGADISLARQYPNPEVGVSVGKSMADAGDEGLVWGIELSIPIESFGSLYNNIQGSKADRDAAQWEARARRLEVTRQLRGLFLGIAVSQQRLAILRDAVQQLEQLTGVARQRVEQGEARPMERTRLEIELHKAQAYLANAEGALSADRQTLNIWLGGHLPGDYQVAANWDQLPLLPPEQETRQRALKQSPLLQASARRIAAGKARLRAEKHQLFPSMSLGAFYERELEGKSFGGTLSINLPVWNWNSGGIAKARAEARAAEYDRELQRRELVAAVLKTRAAAERSFEQVRQYREAIIPKARQSADALQHMYALGEVGIMDLLDARRSLAETEDEMLAGLEESWELYLDLITLMGGQYE